MRVLLDATAVPADRGGVGRYVDHLSSALVQLGVDLVVACQPRDAELFDAMGARVEEVIVGSRPQRLLWEQTKMPALIRSVRADVLHAPHYTLPVVSSRPVVVTLHDATFFTDPDVHLSVKRVFFRGFTRAALRRATRCVVPSAATRDELVRVAGGDPERIDVAYHGVDPRQFHVPSAEDRARVAQSLGLGSRPYVAFLGTLEPRKNLSNLVRGFVQHVASDGGPALVLAGGSGWDRSLDELLCSLPSGVAVLRPGYLPLADLPGFLGGAVVVAYPSLAEGFGLPVLEAMACGAPVLTTRRLALPEVGGDAVAYTDVDADSIGRSLAALVADPARRSSLSVGAVVRASKFTWEASAAAHVRAYERAVSTSR